MNDFEEHYQSYLRKSRDIIAYNLWKSNRSLSSELSRYIDRTSIQTKLFAAPFAAIILAILFFSKTYDIWIRQLALAAGGVVIILTLLTFSNVKESIARFLFDTYLRKTIILNRVACDEQQELAAVDHETAGFIERATDIKYFYSRCRDRIVNEVFTCNGEQF